MPNFVTPWTVARQAPLSKGFSREEYWSGLPFPSSRDLPDPGIEPESPALQADSLPPESPGEGLVLSIMRMLKLSQRKRSGEGQGISTKKWMGIFKDYFFIWLGWI